MNQHPVEARLGLHLIRRRGIMPTAFMIEFLPEEAVPEDFLVPEWNAEEILRYTTAARELAASGEEVLREIGDTPENRARVFVATRALLAEARTYFNPAIERMDFPVQAFVHLVGHVQRVMGTAKRRGFLTPEFARKILTAHVSQFGECLSALHELMFEHTREDGSPGVGWLTPRECEAHLATLCDFISSVLHANKTFTTLLALFEEHGGTREDWMPVWEEFRSGVAMWLPRFEEHAPPAAPAPRGRGEVEAFLRDWGVTTHVEDILTDLDAEAAVLREEIARLQPIADGAVERFRRPTSDEEVLEMAGRRMQNYQWVFVEGGLLPPVDDTSDPKVVLMTGPELRSTMMAAASAGGDLMTFRPFTGQEALWRNFASGFGATFAHERTHIFQARQKITDGFSAGSLQAEAAAVWSELVWVLTVDPCVHTVLALLRSTLKFNFLFRSSIRFHAGIDEDIDAMVDGYREVLGSDRDEAVRRFDIAIQSVGGIGIYWLGEKLLEAFVDAECDGDPVEGFRRLAHETGLMLPGHVTIEGVNPERFELRLPPLPAQVRASRDLFPRE